MNYTQKGGQLTMSGPLLIYRIFTHPWTVQNVQYLPLHLH